MAPYSHIFKHTQTNMRKEKLKIFVQLLIVQRFDLVFWQLVFQDSMPFLNKFEHKFTFNNLKVKLKT